MERLDELTGARWTTEVVCTKEEGVKAATVLAKHAILAMVNFILMD